MDKGERGAPAPHGALQWENSKTVKKIHQVLRSSTMQAASNIQRMMIMTTSMMIGTHNSTSPWTSLAQSSGENSVPVVCSSIPVPARSGTVIPLRDTPPIRQSGLRSASMSTLVVPSTRRSTLKWLRFPVAAACAWNSLPPSVRSTS